jgi:hypothetical protein
MAPTIAVAKSIAMFGPEALFSTSELLQPELAAAA